jgi:hypothetical protein
MKSPFPGMDPYLEDPAFWPDFHWRFTTYWCDYLADRLPEPYEARLNERVNLVAMSPEMIKLIYPDVAVSERPAAASKSSKRARSGDSETMLLEPVTIPHQMFEEVREARIEILHRSTHSLITVLELLSPWNKTGDGFLEYVAKRRAVLQQKVHLVELDLLVGGQRLPLSRPLPAGDYYALVSRSESWPDCDVYHWTVRQPFPAIPIPLRAPDPDLVIDVGAVFAIAYERGRYARSLKYGEKAPAPLGAKDAAWAQKAGKGK